MKLLFDQNISFRICKQLPEVVEPSKHVSDLQLSGTFDFEIWEFAKFNGFTIVTFDADFSDLAHIK